jgi:heme exporter protein C
MATIQRPSSGSAPANRTSARPLPLQGAWWKWATGLLMTYVIYGAFEIANGAVGFGESGDKARIVFFHVPAAILTFACYVAAAYYAIRFLRAGWDAETDAKSAISVELGFLYCILATITGSIFAGVQWGSYWNWDPRETSIVVMLLLYASYLALRGAVADNPQRRGRLAAVYVLIALVPAIFLIWVVPRLSFLGSMHPTNTLSDPKNTSLSYKMVLYPSFLAFTMLTVWLFQLRLRLWKLAQRREGRMAARE